MKEEPKVLIDNILIVKLEENQELEFEVYLTKNNGEAHTKWSPVGSVYYKLQNVITFNQDIKNEEAERIKNLCPMNVFSVKKKQLVVDKLDQCTFCRECINDEKQGKNISLAKERDNYIFTIESIGCIDPVELMRKALGYLIEKSRFYKETLERIKWLKWFKTN